MPSTIELTASGGVLLLDGSSQTWIVGSNTYTITSSVMGSHPLAVIADDTSGGCAVTTSCLNGAALTKNGELYCTGSGSTYAFSNGCNGKTISLDCYVHGAMGAAGRLTVSNFLC
tara:strand:- start:125 stop:469 length:345 start_codon:yes stop_codon:yes gene_type:complete